MDESEQERGFLSSIYSHPHPLCDAKQTEIRGDILTLPEWEGKREGGKWARDKTHNDGWGYEEDPF